MPFAVDVHIGNEPLGILPEQLSRGHGDAVVLNPRARDGRDRLPDGTFRIVEALQPGGDDARRRIGCVLQRGCKSLIHCTLLVYLPSEKTGVNA